jgi:hypothetical protein
LETVTLYQSLFASICQSLFFITHAGASVQKPISVIRSYPRVGGLGIKTKTLIMKVQHFLIFIACIIDCGSPIELLELGNAAFQQRDVSGSTIFFDITTLDSRTTSYNGAFYTLDDLSSAFVQLAPVSAYTAAEQLDEVLCFRVDETGFHTLELRNSSFELIQRYFNGSIASTLALNVSSAVSGVCALYAGTLHFVELNTIRSALGSESVPYEVFDIAVINDWLVALVYDELNSRFGLYNTSGGFIPLNQTQLYDRFLGAELETENAIGNTNVTGQYPTFDLLYEEALGTSSIQLSESGSTPRIDTITLNSFVVAEYGPQSIQNVVLAVESVTTYTVGLPTFNIPGTFEIGPGSTLALDLSGTDIEDGTTLTLFTYGSISGSFEEITVEGWTRSCESVIVENSQTPNEIQVIMSVTINDSCNAGTSALVTGPTIWYSLLLAI